MVFSISITLVQLESKQLIYDYLSPCDEKFSSPVCVLELSETENGINYVSIEIDPSNLSKDEYEPNDVMRILLNHYLEKFNYSAAEFFNVTSDYVDLGLGIESQKDLVIFGKMDYFDTVYVAFFEFLPQENTLKFRMSSEYETALELYVESRS